MAGRPKGSTKRGKNIEHIPVTPVEELKKKYNPSVDSDISVHRSESHLTPLGQSKEVVVPKGFQTLPATELRVIEVARMICDGKSKATCLDYIQRAQNVGIQQAKQYYQAALNWLIPSDMDEYKKGLLQANIERLEKIIEDGIQNRNDGRRGADYLRTAKDAISELNKMLGVGNPRLQIAQENKSGEQQVITIDFQ